MFETTNQPLLKPPTDHLYIEDFPFAKSARSEGVMYELLHRDMMWPNSICDKKSPPLIQPRIEHPTHPPKMKHPPNGPKYV